MLYAKKANRIHRIEEHQIKQFVEQGYDIIDETGRVLEESVPTDPVLLKTSYSEQSARIKELQAENKALRDEIKSLTDKLAKKNTSAPKVDRAEVKEEVAKVEEEKPATARKRRTPAEK